MIFLLGGHCWCADNCYAPISKSARQAMHLRLGADWKHLRILPGLLICWLVWKANVRTWLGINCMFIHWRNAIKTRVVRPRGDIPHLIYQFICIMCVYICLNMHWGLAGVSLRTHWVLTDYSLTTHWLLTEYSLGYSLGHGSARRAPNHQKIVQISCWDKGLETCGPQSRNRNAQNPEK